MDKELRKNKFCGQEFSELDMMEYGCGYADCKYCGHNPRVAAYRKRMLKKYGLKLNDKGLWQYTVIRRGRRNGKLQDGQSK